MRSKFIYFFLFCITLVLFRITPHPPNFTPILSASIMAPVVLGNRINGIGLVLVSMFISDLILGFHVYQFVVYFSLILISLFVSLSLTRYISVILVSFIASLTFFLITNFSVWVIWDYYPKTFYGLVECYTLAIPFFTNTILSTFVYSLIIFYIYKNFNYFKNKILNFKFKI